MLTSTMNELHIVCIPINNKQTCFSQLIRLKNHLVNFICMVLIKKLTTHFFISVVRLFAIVCSYTLSIFSLLICTSFCYQLIVYFYYIPAFNLAHVQNLFSLICFSIDLKNIVKELIFIQSNACLFFNAFGVCFNYKGFSNPQVLTYCLLTFHYI